VLYEKKECFIFARRRRGSFNVRTLKGNIISDNAHYKKLQIVEKRSSLLKEKVEVVI